MPKFLYSVFLAAAASWIVFLFVGSKVQPDSLIAIAFFLFILLISLALTFSLPLFFLRAKKLTSGKLHGKENLLYKDTLRWSLYISFGVTCTLALKALQLITVLNYGLFLAFYVALYFQLKAKK